MYSKTLLVFAVCVKIVFSDDCTQPEDLTFELPTCCDNNETYFDFLEDPCYKDPAEKEATVECLIECIYTQNGLLVNDEVDQENVKKYLQIIKNEEERNRFFQAGETCDKLGKDFIVEKFGYMQKDNPSQCNGYFLVFDTCVMLNAVTRCPEQYLVKSDYCTSNVKFLKECIFNKV